LVDIVSKRGALLLNIGPRADGTIPEPEREILLDIGKWLGTYGDALYGTSPWRVFGEGPTEVVAGQFHDTTGGSSPPRTCATPPRVPRSSPSRWPGPKTGASGSAAWRAAPGYRTPVWCRSLVGSERPVDWHAETDALVEEVGRDAGSGAPFALRVVTQGRQDN